jgi:hypothetical protein
VFFAFFIIFLFSFGGVRFVTAVCLYFNQNLVKTKAAGGNLRQNFAYCNFSYGGIIRIRLPVEA